MANASTPAATSRLQRTLAAQRAELRALQANAIRGAGASRQQVDQIRRTTLEIIRQLKAAGITAGTESAIARATLDDQALFMALQQQAQFTNAHILNTLVAEVQAAQLQIGAIAVRHTEVMLAQAGHAADALRMVPVRAASNMAAMFRPSSPFNGLRDLSAKQIEGLGDELVKGVVRGYHPMRVAREITDHVVGVPEARAATIARTEIMRAYRTSSTAYYADSPACTGWVWECAGGVNTCAACYCMSGQTFAASDEMDSHPNCQCMQIPLTVGWDGTADGEGATSAESLGIEPGEDVFAGMSEADQLAVLGPSKFELYSQGKITLADAVHIRHTAEWGNTMTVGSIKQTLANAAARG